MSVINVTRNSLNSETTFHDFIVGPSMPYLPLYLPTLWWQGTSQKGRSFPSHASPVSLFVMAAQMVPSDILSSKLPAPGWPGDHGHRSCLCRCCLVPHLRKLDLLATAITLSTSTPSCYRHPVSVSQQGLLLTETTILLLMRQGTQASDPRNHETS